MILPYNHITHYNGAEIFWCIGEIIPNTLFHAAWGHKLHGKKEIIYFAKYDGNLLTGIIKVG
jgi:hypothetical protein